MWADRYLKNTVQLKFLNIVELARVLAEHLKISFNTKHYNSLGEFQANTLSRNEKARVEQFIKFVDCYEQSHTPLRQLAAVLLKH
jgi:hypothetical protein